MTENQIKAEECLEKIRSVNKRMKKRKLEIEALKLSATGLGAIRYDKDRVQTSPQNYMEIALADAVDKDAENEEDAASVDELKLTAYHIVRRMDDEDQRTLLINYYLNDNTMTMTEVSQFMYISERQAYYIRDNALEIFGSMI